MKNVNLLLSGVAAAILMVGCAKDKTPVEVGNANGVLTVKIKGESSTRAVIDATNTDALVKQFEDRVVGFSVYVFNWDTGDLEAKTTATGTTATISGLNTIGQKRVVVIANGTRSNFTNGSFIPQFETDPNYSRMSEGYVALHDQTFTDFSVGDKGFLMTGENAAALTINEGANTTTITVKRVVAKVQMGDVTFDDAVTLSDLAGFNLKEASVQMAAGYSTLISADGPITTPTTPAPAWFGGEAGDDRGAGIPKSLEYAPLMNTLPSTAFADYLTEVASALGTTVTAMKTSNQTLGAARAAASNVAIPAFKPGSYFWYVLPNGDAANPTLFTLHGDYNGENYDYPVEVNSDTDSANGANTDGSLIKRNTVYTINLNFHNFVGIDNPDVAGKIASLDVTVDVADWEGPIVQNTTW